MTAATLHTTFALDRLTQLAEHLSSTQFHSLLAPVFGDDLPATCYQRLHDALRNGTVRNPSHRIAPELPGKACYDNLTRCIHLHPQLIADARQAPQMSCELATVLLHEFGHHLDNLLRHGRCASRAQRWPRTPRSRKAHVSLICSARLRIASLGCTGSHGWSKANAASASKSRGRHCRCT